MSLLPLLVAPTEFYHFATTVLREIAPLNEEEYRTNSLARRASYSYLNELVEGAFKLASNELTARGHRPEKTYRLRFQQAAALGVFPTVVAERLVNLAVLRNRSTHENKVVNDELELFPKLLELAVIGFGLYEIASALPAAQPRVIAVDATYVWSKLSTASANDDCGGATDKLKEKITVYDAWLFCEMLPSSRPAS
ncbi:hypothetical protein SAMN05216339_101343 [Nitrosomonas eutropha]|uniref:Uncharacterized protein n=1 Tax=Nitrosomonas eutropha TaxID=916 RepID=A0A1I7F8C3_9PROT|nr:HepT-like ribonuclease domain-containing protein [Nitrosomonas eutropha]SFU32414.1 hypothetical protein SAMN05216339_101343 [Nitrosomonas eutropha]